MKKLGEQSRKGDRQYEEEFMILEEKIKENLR